MTADFIVNARWLREHRGDSNLILVDTRPAKYFRAGHPAGTRHFDPFPFHYSDTSERGTTEFRAQLEWIFSALGITTNNIVVFYEEDAGMRSTRGAWLLEWMGHPCAKILDGGLKALAGEKLATAVHAYEPSAFEARANESAGAPAAYIVSKLGHRDVQIFDVRSDAEYYSERVRAKHGGAIPGAFHLDWTASQDKSGAFKSADELRAQFESLGLDPQAEVITYCQGGYRAAHAYYALRIAGYRKVRNYWGSWGEWGNRDDTPIQYPKRKP